MSEASRLKIVVTERASEAAMARLAAVGDVVVLPKCDEASLIEAAATADAMVVRTYSLINAKVIEAAKAGGRLKVIGRGGVGLDNIDLKAALDAGIKVVYTPAASTHAVADLVVGLIIALQRRVVENDKGMRGGEFDSIRSVRPRAKELRHQTVGVIGMGRIGTAVGFRLANGFGTRIIYHDIREIGWLPFPAESKSSHEAVYAEADVVTLHVPLTKLTRGMIDADALASFKQGSYLVNAARGPVVVARALAEALESGHLAGAAVDVHDPEPPPADYPLLAAPNCVLTAHIGARSPEGLAAMDDVVDDVIAVLQGKEPNWPAGPELIE
ncbi:MAG TPA: NAD(P)-dependent oxidoreductase [Phycisphaerae bacterium]|nr:NAD(P)-dependent oxidoreductase [Phycisphaerae bacterium]HRR85948.1 NAD(P)-dependent oxidoreductase [Phycisphaerae bacterium]